MLDRLAAIGEPNLVCSLHEIDDGGPILVAMQSDVTTWFDGKDAHSKFPAGHAFDLGAKSTTVVLLAVKPLLPFGASSALTTVFAPQPKKIAETSST